jgi:hypothetical protein
MKAVEFIRAGLETSAGSAIELIDNMKDSLLTFPTPKGGNHPMWVLGHLAWSEGEVLSIMIGRDNPLAKWKPIFGYGSEPSAKASDYPSYDEVKKSYQNIHAETLNVLSAQTDADLDKASERCPPQAKSFLGTYGQCWLLMLSNSLQHLGQVADARRAAGRKPLHM